MNREVAVRDVMTREYVGVSESDRVVETVELMLTEGVDSVVVLRGQEPVGVMTGRDVLALVTAGGVGDATVGDAMSATVPSVDPGASIDEAADVMSTEDVSGLLVTEGNEPLGVLTERDLFAAATLEAARHRDPGPGAENGEPNREGTGGQFSSQSICEECGALSRDLVDVGSHLVCPDCRSV